MIVLLSKNNIFNHKKLKLGNRKFNTSQEFFFNECSFYIIFKTIYNT